MCQTANHASGRYRTRYTRRAQMLSATRISAAVNLQVLPLDRSVNDVLSKVFNRPDFARLRVLKVEDFEADADDSGPILLASVTGPMELASMRRLLESQALQGRPLAQSNLAFVDSSVPDRMLFSPAVSRNLTQPLAWHLAAADRSFYPVWTLPDILRVSTAEELADAEAFAREHYGPAPPPGVDMQRPLRRQRRGCRGGKGRKRHTHQTMSHELITERSGSLSTYSPRIMSAPYGSAAATLPYPQPSSSFAGWPSGPGPAPGPAPAMSAHLPPYVHTGYYPGLRI